MRIIIVALCVLMGCGSNTSSIPMLNGKVYDFDDGNRRNELGFEWASVSGGGETNATIFVEPGGINQSIYQLTVGGMRPFGSTGAQVSGARIALGDVSNSSHGTVTDVTAYDGLQLAMSGTPGSYIIQIGTAAIDDFDYYNSYVEVTEEWNVFQIPFDRFMQEGFGRPKTWSGEDLTHIAIYSNLFGPYQLLVDDISFYSKFQPE